MTNDDSRRTAESGTGASDAALFDKAYRETCAIFGKDTTYSAVHARYEFARARALVEVATAREPRLDDALARRDAPARPPMTELEHLEAELYEARRRGRPDPEWYAETHRRVKRLRRGRSQSRREFLEKFHAAARLVLPEADFRRVMRECRRDDLVETRRKGSCETQDRPPPERGAALAGG